MIHSCLIKADYSASPRPYVFGGAQVVGICVRRMLY